jgi:large subunit ribosomal protein L21
MYAVIKTGGKQYKVAEKDTIELDRLSGEAGDQVAFSDVLMVGGEDGVTVGSPMVAGAQVAGEIVEHTRSATILVFKKRRRQNSKRSRGHRQEHTVVRITEILTDGKSPSKTAAPKKTRAKAKVEAAPQAAVEAPTVEAVVPETKPAKPKAPRKPRAPSAAAGKAKKKAEE